MAMNTSGYLDRLAALLADPLRVARGAADRGGAVVGYIGDEIPVPLIIAAGAVPVALRGDPHAPTPHADGILESAFTPALRAIAEQWLAGGFDFLQSAIFPRADDSAQRLYYYLCELQRRGRCGGPRPLLYDIAKIARPASVDYSRESTHRLARELGMRADELAAALQRVTRRESLLTALRERQAADAPLAGSLAWRIRQSAGCDWSESFDDATRAWLADAPGLARPRRIALIGDDLPDDSLHAAIEAAGGSVVLELTGSAQAQKGIASLDALADHFQARRNPVLAMREDAEWAAKAARLARADGVVFWLIEEDEALPWEIARQLHALQRQGVPAALLPRQQWHADERALSAITAFVSALEKRP
jgi:hypothetical protein